jgi:hypothetical protein
MDVVFDIKKIDQHDFGSCTFFGPGEWTFLLRILVFRFKVLLEDQVSSLIYFPPPSLPLRRSDSSNNLTESHDQASFLMPQNELKSKKLVDTKLLTHVVT